MWPAYFGVSAIDPRDGETVIQAVSLLNAEGIQKIVTNLVTNFTGFTPLGTVLVALLGVGVAERSGLISAAMRGLVMKAPPKLNYRNGRFCRRYLEYRIGARL